MRHASFAVLLVVSLALVGSTPAAAQSATQTPSPQPTAQTGPERIDNQTVIVSSNVRTDNNSTTAVITLRSTAVQTATLSDSGRFLKGGDVPTRSVNLGRGETTTVEMPVTRANGYVAVGISTENTDLYAEVLQRPSQESGGLDVLGALTSVQAWFAGAFVAFTWMGLAGYTVMRRYGNAPEVAT
ncbi:hypothetical protein [Haloarcula sediminis]|uniref:hypothetical protein n=1 Tax=Haloarcula sediminis TaxID=3111777 RepID=UPI002D79A955|nr:hypothetical protein [Haloarcula sp. CK38]